MEVKDIVYRNLLLLIKEITPEGSQFETYFESLEDGSDKQARLLTISEDIETEQRGIRNSKIGNVIHSNFEQLVTLLGEFKSDYSDFPNHRINEILFLIELISKLLSSIEDELNLNQNINLDSFELVKLERPIAEKNFFYYDNEDISNSVVLFDLWDIPAVHDYLENVNLPIDLNLNLMSKIGVTENSIIDGQYVLIKNPLADKPAPTWACVALHILKEGLKIHSPQTYDLSPNVSPSRKIISGSEFQQFNDTLIILSEYNHQKDLLDKYLRLYHVLENFMYKFPLVKLERDHNGEVFSIRDFQRMYDKINSSEINALNRLVQKISEETYDASSGQKFKGFVFHKYNQLSPTKISNVAKLNKLFKYLRFTKKRDNELVDLEYDDVTEANISKSFATLIYSFRNSIVHNRETEFHLTHETLTSHNFIDDTAKIVLEEFLIPVIEEIVYFLIIERNEIVWFNNSELNLWDEA